MVWVWELKISLQQEALEPGKQKNRNVLFLGRGD